MLSRRSKVTKHGKQEGPSDKASLKRSAETSSDDGLLDTTVAGNVTDFATVNAELSRIYERYAAIADASVEMSTLNKRLADIVSLPSIAALQNIVDVNSSQHFKELSRLGDILAELYDHSVDVKLHNPATGLRGALEDRKNIEKYFSNAVREATNIERK